MHLSSAKLHQYREHGVFPLFLSINKSRNLGRFKHPNIVVETPSQMHSQCAVIKLSAIRVSGFYVATKNKADPARADLYVSGNGVVPGGYARRSRITY